MAKYNYTNDQGEKEIISSTLSKRELALISWAIELAQDNRMDNVVTDLNRILAKISVKSVPAKTFEKAYLDCSESKHKGCER